MKKIIKNIWWKELWWVYVIIIIMISLLGCFYYGTLCDPNFWPGF